MDRLRKLTLIAVLFAIIVFIIKNRAPATVPAGKGLIIDESWLAINQHPLTPKESKRPPDQTFLTYPEWFLVFSPAEQADYFKKHTSTTFPYMKHVDQLWKSYDIMYDQVKGYYPFNTGYHVMIVVIAGSTTVEYSLKSFYETIIGRVTDTQLGEELTDEDKFNAAYEQSYVDFIGDYPWYEYDFSHQLKTLWANTPFTGPHVLRKFERRYYLTTELMVKSGYGWLIGLGTKSTYGVASEKTAVIFDTLPADLTALNSVTNIKNLPKGMILADFPRYAKFTHAVEGLALRQINFREVAGNNSAIMLTVVTKTVLYGNKNTCVLFTQPIFTRPGFNRIALATPVSNLSNLVRHFSNSGIWIEHIYDY
jgi:hypothetical protein